MSTSLPIKSSSRAGRFKKKLVSAAHLLEEAPVIVQRMQSILESFHQGALKPAEFTAIYLVTVLANRYPGDWLGAKHARPIQLEHNLPYPIHLLSAGWEPNIQRRLQNFKTLGDLFNFFAFKSTPSSVNRSILGWSTNHYGLELMFRIPKPHEVLAQQKIGRRCVSVILEKEKASHFILGERDSLGFTMHDLIHADHFYHNNQSYQGQLGFYGFLDHCLTRRHFDQHLSKPAFESEFEYLIADMNAYPIHLMKCFKSALIHYQTDTNEFGDWLKKLDLSDEENHALQSLSTAQYEPVHDQILLNLLSRYRSS